MDFLRKTFGGLNRSYYFRHFVFGALISYVFMNIALQNPNRTYTGIFTLYISNAILYPYARFVYEQVINFLVGNQVFFINAILMLVVKLFTMVLCWFFSLFIAPIGLAYLFYHHTKAASKRKNA